jgi:hypothetical protein
MNNSINIVMGTINHEYIVYTTANIYPSRAKREKYVSSANNAHNVMTILARDLTVGLSTIHVFTSIVFCSLTFGYLLLYHKPVRRMKSSDGAGHKALKLNKSWVALALY